MHVLNNYFILNSSVYCNPEYHLGEPSIQSAYKHHCSLFLDHFFRFRNLISFISTKELKRNLSRVFDRISMGIPPPFWRHWSARKSTVVEHALNYFTNKNRPFYNPFRGRSDRQGGRTGNNHRRYQKCQ
jgi:hypothetical protein